jgi:hypothetical protein
MQASMVRARDRHSSGSRLLRDGTGPDQADDVLPNYLATGTCKRLVLTQGRPLRAISQWLAQAITGALRR